MSTCPACGVSVVSGYVKCPRCGARQPSINFRRPGATADAGGTAVEGSSMPAWIPFVGAIVIAGAIIAFFALRHGGGKGEAAAEPPPPIATTPVAPAAAHAPTLAPGFTALSPPPAPAGPTAEQVATELGRTLEAQRLWSTVSAVGTTLEVHSRTCGDPGMRPALDAIAATAHAAGLTRLRCVEQSGTVAFTRDL